MPNQLAAASSGQDVDGQHLGPESHSTRISLLHVHAGRLPLIMEAVTGAGAEALRSDECLRCGRYGTDRVPAHASGVQGHHARHFTDKVKADALVAEYQPYISRAPSG